MSLQESASYVSVSAPSVVYSVLEFPKRASALSDVIPDDTEYANISYENVISGWACKFFSCLCRHNRTKFCNISVSFLNNNNCSHPSRVMVIVKSHWHRWLHCTDSQIRKLIFPDGPVLPKNPISVSDQIIIILGSETFTCTYSKTYANQKMLVYIF